MFNFDARNCADAGIVDLLTEPIAMGQTRH
jgi:hypothetical protein